MLSTARPLVLVVDDDPDTRELYRLVLEMADYRVLDAGSISDAVRLSQMEHPAMAIADWRLPDGDGIELADELAGVCRETGLLAVTGMTLTTAEIALAHARGFRRVLQKPVLPDALVRTVGEMLQCRTPAESAALT
jgi:DNA-binding response OmpR family regulator